MTLLLAAVGATVAALFELTVGPYLRIGDAQPHLVLVGAVVVTIVVGLEPGLMWAFVGGLGLDVLAQRPLGSTAFALLLCVGGAALLGRVLSRIRPLAPIIATFILSLAYSLMLFTLVGALRAPLPVTDPLGIVFPGAVYDAILATIIGPLAVSVHDRRAQRERVDW
jgi:rod shape-determining protein MreD